MKRKIFTSLLIIGTAILLFIGGCGDDNNNNISTDKKDVGKVDSYLFVQNGTSGNSIDNGDGTYTLTINGIAPQTIYFSDRPKRDAGQIPMQDFFNTFPCFESNPPNAAIDILNAVEGNDVAIVELFNPVYDDSTATLQYTMRYLKDVNHSISTFNERNDGVIPESFGAVALFIDSCSNRYVDCGDGSGATAGIALCCRCYKFLSGCDFQNDCCSFERCQSECTKTYGNENKYLFQKKHPDDVNEKGAWVDTAEGWNNYDG